MLAISIVHTCCNGQVSTNKPEPFRAFGLGVQGDTVKEPGKNIMVVYQDKRNIYWFGSWETGVYRYDGKTLVNYTTKHGLPHNRVDEIKEDASGNIYFNGCYPFSAITRFNGRSFSVLTAITGNYWQSQPGDLWFKNPRENGRVYRYDGNILHQLQLPRHPQYPNPFEVYSIFNDGKGNTWFGTNPVGVCRYNGHSFNWISETDVTELDGGPANGVRSIIEDKEGYLWFNTAFRYRVYDSVAINGGHFYERQKSIGSLDGNKDGNLNEYLSITSDNNNHLWIATYRNGVWKYDGREIKQYPVRENGKDINLFYIYKDNKGDIWLGTHANGVYKFDGQQFMKPFGNGQL